MTQENSIIGKLEKTLTTDADRIAKKINKAFEQNNASGILGILGKAERRAKAFNKFIDRGHGMGPKIPADGLIKPKKKTRKI